MQNYVQIPSKSPRVAIVLELLMGCDYEIFGLVNMYEYNKKKDTHRIHILHHTHTYDIYYLYI